VAAPPVVVGTAAAAGEALFNERSRQAEPALWTAAAQRRRRLPNVRKKREKKLKLGHSL
jgi:hypothetical protein